MMGDENSVDRGSKNSLGSGQGTHKAYFVEVRGVLDTPFTFPGTEVIVTGEWRRFPIKVTRCDVHPRHFHGAWAELVPVQNWMCRQADELHLMDFDAAYTWACILQTQARATVHAIYTRLVEVEVQYSWSAAETRRSTEIRMDKEAAKFSPIAEEKV